MTDQTEDQTTETTAEVVETQEPNAPPVVAVVEAKKLKAPKVVPTPIRPDAPPVIERPGNSGSESDREPVQGSNLKAPRLSETLQIGDYKMERVSY